MTVFIEPCSCLFISTSFQDATSSSFIRGSLCICLSPYWHFQKSHLLKFSFRGSSRELKGDFAPFISCSFYFMILFCTQWACLSISMIGWVSRDSTAPAPAHVYILVDNWDHWLWLRRIIHLRLACYQYVNVLLSLFGLVVSLSYTEAFYQVPVSSCVWNASHWFTVWSIWSNLRSSPWLGSLAQSIVSESRSDRVTIACTLHFHAVLYNMTLIKMYFRSQGWILLELICYLSQWDEKRDGMIPDYIEEMSQTMTVNVSYAAEWCDQEQSSGYHACILWSSYVGTLACATRVCTRPMNHGWHLKDLLDWCISRTFWMVRSRTI